MNLGDTINYVLFTNPISSYASSAAYSVKDYLVPAPKVTQVMQPLPLWKLAAAAGPYIRIAAVSGALAVGLGAYGAHKKFIRDCPEMKQIFETANRYHFMHTLAILGLPMCRYPMLAATFFVSGILMFSGSCYYHAFTGDASFNKITPYGGVSFIIGWLAMCI